MLTDEERYMEALKKRALGYEYEEKITLVEQTPAGTKKKIMEYKKHMPADVATAKWLLGKVKKAPALAPKLKELSEKLEEVVKNGD